MRCEQCGERDAAVNLTSVADGTVKQEHLCQACFDERVGPPPPPPTPAQIADRAAETLAELEGLAAELLAARDGGDADDEQRLDHLERRYRMLAPEAPDPPNTRAYRARPRPPRQPVHPGRRPTLWRGPQLLGAMNWSPGLSPSYLNGVLLPTDAYLPLANINQKRSRRPHGLVVVQTETATDAYPWPDPQRVEDEESRAREIAAASAEPMEVPPERMLQVRDDEGRVLPVTSVWLTEYRLLDGPHFLDGSPTPEAAIHRTRVPGAADQQRLWYVMVEFDEHGRVGP